ncbi:MAG: hypothetical protein K9G05_06685 [Candidatus Nanopelagicales bacterium]|nr:hypothetical protein [Candidatus Nanopelagicales bacterium]MCF8539400.1 hypothetical protein [Candidatus Nanopelagicales bacterium]MCF8551746.1 hypothetical protein [Candidatus Nanopelagicales bacterium]
MKRFLVLLSLIGSAVAGFLWWKKREIARAQSVSADPWPQVVAETTTVVAPASTAQPASDSELQEPPAPSKPAAKAKPRKATKKSSPPST